MSDWELIQQYARTQSEVAFAELVHRHLGWVYSVALRRLGRAQLAEEVAQSVFILLAGKAGHLRRGTILGGWLFRTTCFVSSRALRAEQRQKHREHIASSMNPTITLPEDNDSAWERLAPHLDEAVAALSQVDRSAVLLRFYEKKPLQEIGEHLGISEEAAKKRVSRAVDRLRDHLLKRGVALGGTVLMSVLVAKNVEAVPVALEAGVLSAISAGASASAVLPQLARETLTAWRWAKIKLVSGLTTMGLVVMLVAINTWGWLGDHAANQPLSGNSSRGLQATASVGAQPPQAPSAATPRPSAPTRQKGVLTGVVWDDRGHPIAGAKVWGGFSSAPFAQATTDSSGQFALDKVAAPPFLTVTADGFAADQQQFDPADLSGTFVFRLAPAPALKLLLVDESGQGVPGVSLFLADWWGRAGTLAQHLPQQSGADGHLQWLSAPKGELELQFGKTGYRYSRTNKLAADGLEHVIVLHPAGTLRGTVTDAETGAPVVNFDFTPGHAQPWVPSNPTPLWDLHSKPGSNGLFKMALDEEQVAYVRIQAEGYETLEAEIPSTNGLEVVQEFSLRRESEANSIRGTVLMPDGNPAVGVEVALCTAYVGVMVNGGSFAPEAFGRTRDVNSNDYRTMTDRLGAFSFVARPRAHTVVAIGAAGIGQVRCFDLSKPLEIRLQAWGRVEGTVRTADGQWSNRKLIWGHPGRLTDWMTVFYDPKGSSAVSDANGSFTMEHIPPGDGHVIIDDGPGSPSIISRSVRVDPGQTVQVQVGGVGRPVIGRLVAPPGVEIRNWTNQVTHSELHVEWADYHIPKDLTGNAVERWKLEFEDTAEGRAWFRDQYSYNFQVAGDGSFSIPEVLPGNYRLFIDVAQGYLGSGADAEPSRPGGARIASTGMKVIVTEIGQSTSALDLGDVLLVGD
ncbi:MAG TPA: sigma-70 family RNA polymerase sigma factor [Verrucomicrobiae bacterium]|nr:sigma-70 family RNA polymerase sigma factor [Verrucomicrobiae bacterium]